MTRQIPVKTKPASKEPGDACIVVSYGTTPAGVDGLQKIKAELKRFAIPVKYGNPEEKATIRKRVQANFTFSFRNKNWQACSIS